MCPYCGSIYLPEETRDKRIREYGGCYGNIVPLRSDIPTNKQILYAEFLCEKLHLKYTNMYYMSKNEMIEFISYLKNAYDMQESIIKNFKKYVKLKSKEKSKKNNISTDKEYSVNFERREDVIAICRDIKTKRIEFNNLMNDIEKMIEEMDERKIVTQQ